LAGPCALAIEAIPNIETTKIIPIFADRVVLLIILYLPIKKYILLIYSDYMNGV
jgi:hypothetical protein